jgi:transcriptional regulator with PAS, ATPase and Fis domain
LAQLFAFCIQFCRAFHRVFDCIIGASPFAIRLRVHVWQSIFTHDMRRYRRLHFDRMRDFTTLITGPSGTGKELVARAIGLSRFIPFDPRRKQLVFDTTETFYTLNLSALSEQLIEAELFGHKKGAFTGAVSDRKGWLETCPELGSVFLDEMGEIDLSIQVKLLRVLEDRTFSRVGETKDRRFEGKIITATNRDLALEMQEGRFRTDLYYRLCADTISTPSLFERIRGDDDERRLLLLHLAQREIDEDAELLVAEVEKWIDENLGPDYPWPGNVRELVQCLRNVLIRREYHPAIAQRIDAGSSATDQLAAEMRSGNLTADELLRRYCTLVYREVGSFEQAARRLKLDRRTVRAKVEEA